MENCISYWWNNFNIFRSDEQNVWRKSNKEFWENNLQLTVKHRGDSIMVWQSMSAATPTYYWQNNGSRKVSTDSKGKFRW